MHSDEYYRFNKCCDFCQLKVTEVEIATCIFHGTKRIKTRRFDECLVFAPSACIGWSMMQNRDSSLPSSFEPRRRFHSNYEQHRHNRKIDGLTFAGKRLLFLYDKTFHLSHFMISHVLTIITLILIKLKATVPGSADTQISTQLYCTE